MGKTRVLILGGTRFTGKAVVQRLVDSGHEVTVVSRRPGENCDGLRFETGERDAVLARLRGSAFDACLDFICYDAGHISPVFDNLDPGQYVMVSSTWLPRLDGPAGKIPGILAVTREYLKGKAAAEREISRLRDNGRSAAIVRLPVILGQADHTGRCRFYLDRMADGEGLILVNGGRNLAQIVWSEDLANALARWIASGHAADQSLWHALPDEGASVKTILAEMAGGREVRFVDIGERVLAQRLPQYLEAEPLWRESPVPKTGHSVFTAAGVRPTRSRDWLSALFQSEARDGTWPTRAGEAALIGELDRA